MTDLGVETDQNGTVTERVPSALELSDAERALERLSGFLHVVMTGIRAS